MQSFNLRTINNDNTTRSHRKKNLNYVDLSLKRIWKVTRFKIANNMA
jgi:hypothetical protein